MKEKYMTIIKRFMAKVVLNRETECWIWVASKNNKGYGTFGTSGNGKSTLAHRFSYENFIGDIPNGGKILHSCDNPSCVSPFHLRSGTQQDNVDDMVKRKRDAKAKLTPEEVIFIRSNMHLQTIDLAAMFNVSNANISLIKHNKTWKNPKHLEHT